MDWLWGGSSTNQATTGTNQATPNQSTAMHQRPLTSITKEHKDQFFIQFDNYTKEQEDKDSIICVDTATLKIWRKQLPGN